MRLGIREFIFFVVLLAVPVASFFYVFKPRNVQIAQARSEIALKQSRLDTLAAVAAKIDDIGLEIEKGRESVQMIEAKLPNAQDVEGILEQVWQIAKRNKLTVKSVKSDKSVPAAMYMEQPLKVIGCTRGDPVECSVKAELVTATSGVRMFWTDGRTNEAACAAVKTMAQSSLSSQGRQVASYGPCLCALNRTETSNLRCTIEARYRAG